MALSVSFLWDMLGTILLYFVCFEFSHLLFHLLMESILLPCCISEGDSWVLGGRCFALYKAVFASGSASSFSSISWWAEQWKIPQTFFFHWSLLQVGHLCLLYDNTRIGDFSFILFLRFSIAEEKTKMAAETVSNGFM